MKRTKPTHSHGSTDTAFALIENFVLILMCLGCILGVFLCVGVMIAMLDNLVPVITLACLFCAGTMVTASEVLKPKRGRF